MEKITVIIRQHTPLIHFQHYQDNATLRASEVKPQLDRFLLTLLGEGVYEAGIELARLTNWLVGDGTHPALDYKMKISPMDDIEMLDINTPKRRNGEYKMKRSKSHGQEIIDLNSYPTYFANMDADYNNPVEYKRFSMTDRLKITFIFKNAIGDMRSLIDFISTNSRLSRFFIKTNFGTRASKGFGSFYIDEKDPTYVSPSKLCTYTFSVDLQSEVYQNICRGKDFEKLFKVIEIFYKTLRSGINEKDNQRNTVFYFKSLAYEYCTNHLMKKWDKRKIQEAFYDIPVTTPDASCDIKDVLGFSTDEQWLDQGDSLKKSVAVRDSSGHWQKAPVNNITIPTRLQSPLLFKPIYDEVEDIYHIYLLFKEKEVKLDEFLSGEKICIESKSKYRNLFIDLPDHFSLQDYFDYILVRSLFDIHSHVDPQYHTHDYFDILEDIYEQLKSI